mgnify:CR=1 FL=1
MNPLFATDSYKLSHKDFCPPGTQYIYSNLTFRFDKYFEKYYPNFDHKAVWFGLQAFIKKTLIKQWNEEFFNKPKAEVLNELKLLTSAFAMTDFSHFEALHDLGYLPIEIKSLPEGSLINMGTPVLTIVNTHPDFQWLTNYLESVISAEIWKPTTVATIGREFRNLSNKWALKTTGSIEGTDFQNHDFGYRGTANTESSAACGAGFLLSTLGTDNIPAIDFVGRYYNTDVVENPVAFSIPAGEHSVTTLGINYYNAEDKQQGELEYLKWLLTEIQPSGLFSYVADSYDYWGFLENILPTLKDIIMSRDGKYVVRPDSGNVIDVICGKIIPDYSEEFSPESAVLAYAYKSDKYELSDIIFKYKDKYFKGSYSSHFDKHGDLCDIEVTSCIEYKLTAEDKGTVEWLYETFGGTKTEQGYKLLDPHIGMIYGDGITYERAEQIFNRLHEKGFASTNVVFGIGSWTMNQVSRDSLGIAVKATNAIVDGKQIPIYKQPKTDSTKNSAKGLLKVIKNEDGSYTTLNNVTVEEEQQGELVSVFKDGKLLREQTFEEIRNLIWK